MNLQRKKFATEITLLAKKVAGIVRESDSISFIPNSEWTVGDMIAHVIITQNILTSLISKKKNVYIKNKDTFIEEASHNISREYISNINKNLLSKYKQRNSTILAKSLSHEYQDLLNESRKVADSKKFITHYGKVDLTTLFSYCLTHLLIHGCTLAKTLNKTLPVTKENTILTIPFLKVIMPKLYNKQSAKGFYANFVFSLTGGEPFVLLCTPKGVTITNKLPSKIDCYLRMDALTFFLISNSFMSQWKALFLRKIYLGGKKPWLALKLQSLFKGL